ncbi:MAG: tetratricopeptide repeat protein, partial [Gemmatimonadota bacterium]
DIFETARPDAGGDSMPVRELVDRAADRIDEDFSTHPSVLAELSLTVGSLYASLGERENARDHLERSVQLLDLEEPGPTRDIRLAMALRRLSSVVRGLDADSAAVLSSRAFALAAAVAPKTPEAAMVILEAANSALEGRKDSARAARLSAVRTLRTFPDQRALLATALQNVAHDGGDSALKFQEEALDIRRKLYGEWHTAVAASLNDVAMLYHERERGSGDSLMLRAIEIDRDLLGPTHHTTLSLLNNFAWMKVEQGRHRDAIPLFRQVLSARERQYPNEQWPLAYPLHGLGTTLMEAGELEEAEQILRRTVEVLTEDRASTEAMAYLTGIARVSLSKCLLKRGKLDESERQAWLAIDAVSGRPDLANNLKLAQKQLEAIAVARSEASVR